VIGIAGPSCSGKTWLAEALAAGPFALRAIVLSMDWYYKDLSALSLSERSRANFDVPEALDWPLLTDHLHTLVRREEICRPVYDFSTHVRTPDVQNVKPKEVVIVEGLLALYCAKVRALYDTSVFVDADDRVILARRGVRDTQERGRSLDSVLQQFEETVRPMAERYVIPSRAFADVIVDGEAPLEISAHSIMAHVRRNAG